MSNVFDQFTNQYALSKTLRFELKPVGKTLENMREHLRFDENLQTFLADQEIEDAYQALKPVFDSLHEEFITESLESESASQIDFKDYYYVYRERGDLKDEEKKLRLFFSKTYEETANSWRQRAGLNGKDKSILVEKGYKILTEKGILEYIRKNVDQFSEIKSPEEILTALKAFEGFFTYLSGFNQNRENYYEVSKEAATAVASRIVHDNLPKFCDNITLFEERDEEYKNIYENLQKLGKSLVDKEGTALIPIEENMFNICFYNGCLSQSGIEAYNNKIGNFNFLINLFNQAKNKEENFKKLAPFKILYKQIGCGERKSLFFALTHNKKEEAEKVRNEKKEAFSVEEVLELANLAGKKYFEEISDDGFINTMPEFIDYLSQLDDFKGVYWSKTAINTISTKYFANWHDLKDKLKKAKIFQKADKSSENDVKIPDAVELSALFSVLDNGAENWKETFFKDGVLKEAGKKEIIILERSPSKALLGCIFSDLKNHAAEFVKLSQDLLKLDDYSKNKDKIKSCFEHALDVNRMLKYFLVKESKVKGNPINSQMSQALDVLLHSEDANWFKWYDALRNFLTKKPQDDVKNNKLKLNFENGSLLGGWSDGQEKSKAAVLLRKEADYYLGILKKKTLFDTNKVGNPLYKCSASQAGRLILANLKFQTLAGKGFLGEFGISYGQMGKENPQQAINSLQKIIKERYVEKYPILKSLIDKNYSDKKVFDKEVQEKLIDCYVCRFIPVNWSEVSLYVDSGDMYLFKLSNKDFLKINSGGNKNLHSLYWEAVFVENSPFQLSGGGEVFYRKKVISDNDLKLKKGYENKPYILENKRFTQEKFLFHCPIKINYQAKNYSKPEYAIPEFNGKINSALKVDSAVNFLGIDRGEKHLAYYSLIDSDGKMKEQGTLNMPFVDKDGHSRTVKAEKRTIGQDEKEKIEVVECKDYNELLQARAGNRDHARKNWQTIGTIKELKEGYISLVVRTIADLAINHGAYIVMEDLNTGFKKGRQKIEHAVYQKQELALAKKLNFLVDKKAQLGEVGSVTKALQLTPPVQNYGDIENRKQVGIVLYTRANYTSQTDPVTGWRKSIYLKKGSETAVKKQLLDNFREIDFDGSDYRFIYSDERIGKEWILYSGKNGKGLDRFRGERNKDMKVWVVNPIDVVQILDGVFTKFDKNRSLLSQIEEGIELTKVNEHAPWESLRFAIDLIQQIRNSGKEIKDDDFLQSPVRDDEGRHFDSREFLKEYPLGEKGISKSKMPINGDSNGAYNIARKGILMSEHIKRGYSLLIRDEEWDAWLAGEATWGNWIKENEKLLVEKNFKKSKAAISKVS